MSERGSARRGVNRVKTAVIAVAVSVALAFVLSIVVTCFSVWVAITYNSLI